MPRDTHQAGPGVFESQSYGNRADHRTHRFGHRIHTRALAQHVDGGLPWMLPHKEPIRG